MTCVELRTHSITGDRPLIAYIFVNPITLRSRRHLQVLSIISFVNIDSINTSMGNTFFDQISVCRITFIYKIAIYTVVKELRSKMFGQHPGYFKAVFLKQTRIIIVSIYKYTVYIMFWIMMLYDCYYY